MVKVREELDQKDYIKDIHFLYILLRTFKNEDEFKLFLKDIMTRSEIIMLKRRWQIANLLTTSMDIRTIARKTNSSTQTVIKIKQILEEGNGGLIKAINKISEETKPKSSKTLLQSSRLVKIS